MGTSLTIKGGRIENNRARGAGAILNGGAVKANISDETEAGTKEAQKATVIQGNTSDYAGAIYNTGSMELNHTIIKSNTSTAQLSSESAGGVYSSGSLFALNSGALYGNTNEDEKNKFTSAQDLLIRASKAARVLPAAQMYDPEVTDAGYFADYRWIDVSKISNKVETGGLEGVKSSDGKYKAIVYDDREIVAKVGDEGFSTLKEALQKAGNGGMIDLVPQKYEGLDNAVLLEQEITLNKNITIRMNGASIKTTTDLNRLFKVGKGCKLTLKGDGDIFGRIQVLKGAELSLDGNVRIYVQTENIATTQDAYIPVVNEGTVTVSPEAELDRLLIRQKGTLKAEGKIKELGINYAVNMQENVLHNEVGKLTIHGFSESKPSHILKVKDGFRADEILYSSVAVQQGSQGDVTLIQGESSDYLATVKENISVVFSDKKNFAVIETEGNNVVLRKESTDGVYLAGSGNDAKDGKTSANKVKTFARAKELLEEYGWNKIYVVGTVAIDNEQEWELKEGQRLMRYPTYTAGALVQVNAKGALTLKNITIDGAYSVGISAAAPLVVVKGGVCNIEDGTVLQNNKNTTNNLSSAVNYGGAVYSEGTVQMNGGTIAGNQAYVGGGVFVNSGTFILSDGEIRNNTATGKDSAKHYPSAGGGVLIARTGQMIMEGGTVSGNTAYHGGGIYVNGGKGNYENGVLFLKNVAIRENTSRSGSGKALAACPTSKVTIHVTDGAAIYDNKPVKSSGISDLYIKSGNYGSYQGHPSIKISPFMLGGGAYHWKDSSGRELPLNGIKLVYGDQLAAFTEATANNITASEDDFLVKIQNNEAWTQGGGIGTNGNVIIGSETGELVDIDIEKIWEKVSYDYQKPEVDMEILRGVEGQEPANQEKVGFVRLTEKDGWKASVKGLPKVSQNGETYIYGIREAENGYLSEIGEPAVNVYQDGATIRTSYSWKVKNTPQYNLKLEKQVERDPGDLRDSTFHFTIQLSDIGDQTLQIVRTKRDGTTEEEQLTFVKGNGNSGTAEVDLAAGESVLLTGIPGAMNYMISESLSGAKEIYINGEAQSEKGTAYELYRDRSG
ncbi:MAG: Cna B-type domain-containing protein [Lachnospiraceae bacterium]|nr:Cna B-type domain-containing protein [Lachnospiraceae bacterium]